MTRTWKLTAVGLGLSLGGLAAVAGVPGRLDKTKGAAGRCQPPPVVTVPVSGAVVVARADEPPAPIPVAVPPAAPMVATPAEVPAAQPLVIPPPPADPKPAAKADAPKVTSPPPPVKELDLPMIVPAGEKTPAPAPPIPAAPAANSPPAAAVPPPPVPAPLSEPVPTPPAPAPLKVADPVPARDVGSQGVLGQPAPLKAADPVPAPKPAEPALADPVVQPAAVVEKKLKVMLHMGDDRPRFEVRDGDEVYLKVTCDKVDVKSPSERGETMSTLRATGGVTFVTPGGEGSCDELTVAPGTGQVVVAGKVTFKYSWGRAETTVSGDRMTFRLGTTPGAGPAAIPASHRK